MLFERYGTGKCGAGKMRKECKRLNHLEENEEIRSAHRSRTDCLQRVDGIYFALYSLAVNSLWPTDCGCPTVPFGAFPSSGNQR